ncbi:PLAT domain-containing protein 3-like [Mercurialis annua]|uniref:PLAT domain-containing protein 3-like n=1 Tax=Mercurialis annua TaxID=3986 RepID=UPI00215E0C65|nr:PLAT domain-containing protein 3-like [Mercurialis annua]
MKSLLITSILLLALFSAASADDHNDDDECVYTLYVKTGSIFKAGTDSKISLTLSDAQGRSVWINDLQSWGGLMGPDHDYYERGNLDIFSGRGRCGGGGPLCRLNLTSDGLGSHHGWYCEYIEVTSTGPHKECRQTLFYVDQWLATDVSPYKLTAEIDGCGSSGESVKQGIKGRFFVGNKNSRRSADA